MKNWWIRFGCFLTGYNYSIVRNSSEVAAKTVKRYTSAMLIVCILWAFIGYCFTRRYLHGGSLRFCGGSSHIGGHYYTDRAANHFIYQSHILALPGERDYCLHHGHHRRYHY